MFTVCRCSGYTVTTYNSLSVANCTRLLQTGLDSFLGRDLPRANHISGGLLVGKAFRPPWSKLVDTVCAAVLWSKVTDLQYIHTPMVDCAVGRSSAATYWPEVWGNLLPGTKVWGRAQWTVL